MDRVWAPWRIEYIRQEPEKGCIFCNRISRKRRRQDFILYQNSRVFVMMNRFPYNPGHLLIAPVQHTADLAALSAACRADLMGIIAESIEILRRKMDPEGFNLGMNLGSSGGAGVRDHLHFHLVPRWPGDTNFMPVIAEVKVIPEHLDRMYRLLRPAYGTLERKMSARRKRG